MTEVYCRERFDFKGHVAVKTVVTVQNILRRTKGELQACDKTNQKIRIIAESKRKHNKREAELATP